jgi:hypothetical protein
VRATRAEKAREARERESVRAFVGTSIARARARAAPVAPNVERVLEVARAAVPLVALDPNELVPMTESELDEMRATLVGQRFGITSGRISRSRRWTRLVLGDGRELVFDADAPEPDVAPTPGSYSAGESERPRRRAEDPDRETRNAGNG